MKLIFIDFDKTIIDKDSIDLMRDNFIHSENCRDLWDAFERQWKDDKISNYECLLNQFLLYDFKSTETIKNFILSNKINMRNNISKFIQGSIENGHKIIIISDNFYFIIKQVIDDMFNKKNATLGGECKFFTKEEIKNFLRNTDDFPIKVFSNFLAFNTQGDYVRPFLMLKNFSKEELKTIVVEHYKQENIEETIFIGANKTKEDICLSLFCKKIYLFEGSEMAEYFDNKKYRYTAITNKQDIKI